MSKIIRGAATIITVPDVTAGYSSWQMHTSDWHIDSLYCDRDALFRDLDLARERNAKVYIYGDLFDAMQGRFDPRRSYDEIRPEYKGDNYYDRLIEDTIHMLTPYAHNIDVMANGNHELGVLKNINSSLLDRLAYGLNERTGSNITVGSYGGWILWTHMINGVNPYVTRLKYFHGAGADAPMSRGILQSTRQSGWLPDANVVVNGHNHNSYTYPLPRERMTPYGQGYMDVQWHLRSPGYKHEYNDGSKGYQVTKGTHPKPIGSCWTRFDLDWKSPTLTKSGRIKIHAESSVNDIVFPLDYDFPEVMYDGPVYPEE